MNKFISLLTLFQLVFMNHTEEVNRVIANTDQQYKKINNYEVDILVSMEVPAFRMPKKRYKVFFMQPDLISIKSKGFGILPKTGLFTSPLDNFDNLSKLSIKDLNDINYPNDVVLSGLVLLDSLKIKMPNEYSKLTFKPIVDVRIDTLEWVIKSVITRIDTLKLFEIYNYYDSINKEYYMPVKSEIRYFLKDKKFANWLNKDINSIIGKSDNEKHNELIEGNIFIQYSNYKINQGIPESVFKK